MESSTKSWDPIWEKVFSTGEWGKYPPEELIRFIARTFYQAPDRSQVTILDAGCGTGAGTWYLAREGFSVTSLDGAPSALRTGKQRLEGEGLPARPVQGDLIALPFRSGTFDAVTDIAAISQNRLAAIRSILSEIHRILKPGGRFFTMMLRTGCWGDGMGTRLEQGTYIDIPEGPLAQRGVTHFFSESEIQELFRPFQVRSWETSLRTYENRTREISFWVVIAEK